MSTNTALVIVLVVIILGISTVGAWLERRHHHRHFELLERYRGMGTDAGDGVERLRSRERDHDRGAW